MYNFLDNLLRAIVHFSIKKIIPIHFQILCRFIIPTKIKHTIQLSYATRCKCQIYYPLSSICTYKLDNSMYKGKIQ